MADAASKVTILFEAQGGDAPTGWTETFWSSEANLKTVVDTCLKKYVPKRAVLLGIGAKVFAVKATSVPTTRLSRVEFVTGKTGISNLFTRSPDDNYDPTQVDLLCKVQDAAGHRRQLWLGGLPDSTTDQIKEQGINGDFIAQPCFKQYVQAILDVGYQIRYKTSNGPPKVYAAAAIEDVQPVMVRNRKRGRPFFLYRGRRAV